MAATSSETTQGRKEEKEYCPYNFRKIYDGQGEKGDVLRKPLFTKDLLKNFVAKYHDLMEIGEDGKKSVVYKDALGNNITVTYEQDLKTKTKLLTVEDDFGNVAQIPIKGKSYIHFNYAGITHLASGDYVKEAFPVLLRSPLHVSVEDMKDLLYVQRFAPLYFNVRFDYGQDPTDYGSYEAINSVIPTYVIKWEESTMCQKLVEILEEHSKAEEMLLINKVVCFGCGNLGASTLWNDRSNIQHIAARTIADTLSRVQENDVQVYAQAKFETAQGLAMIDENTFVLSIGTTAEVTEIAVDLAGPRGPAGMLHDKMILNAEVAWTEKMIRGAFSHPSPYEKPVCDRVWKWMQSCTILPEMTDEAWFGHPSRPKVAAWPKQIWKDGAITYDPKVHKS